MDLNTIRHALDRTRDWLSMRSTRGGVLEQTALTYRGLMKAPLGFASVGLHAEGVRSVDLIKTRLIIGENGDISDASAGAKDPHPAPSLEYFYPYRTSYVAIGAHRLGCYDVSQRVGRFVLSLQDTECGGFVAKPAAKLPAFHICGTAQAALAALTLGKWEVAAKAGDFLTRVLHGQPPPSKHFYFVTAANAAPITGQPAFRNPYCRLSVGKPGQCTYVTGLAAGVLAVLHRVAGDRRYLDAATGYHRLSCGCHDDAFANAACGKLAWSSAVLFAITGEPHYRDKALRAAKYLCNVATGDPPMHAVDSYPDFNLQPPSFTFELAFEYALWLCEIVKELG